MNGASVIACPPGFGLGFDGSFDSDFLTEHLHLNCVIYPSSPASMSLLLLYLILLLIPFLMVLHL